MTMEIFPQPFPAHHAIHLLDETRKNPCQINLTLTKYICELSTQKVLLTS